MEAEKDTFDSIISEAEKINFDILKKTGLHESSISLSTSIENHIKYIQPKLAEIEMWKKMYETDIRPSYTSLIKQQGSLGVIDTVIGSWKLRYEMQEEAFLHLLSLLRHCIVFVQEAGSVYEKELSDMKSKGGEQSSVVDINSELDKVVEKKSSAKNKKTENEKIDGWLDKEDKKKTRGTGK